MPYTKLSKRYHKNKNLAMHTRNSGKFIKLFSLNLSFSVTLHYFNTVWNFFIAKKSSSEVNMEATKDSDQNDGMNKEVSTKNETDVDTDKFGK